MCVQVDYVYTCGHRAFKRFDNCARFGQDCFGAGANHKDEPVADRVCFDCQVRQGRRGGGGGGHDHNNNNTPTGAPNNTAAATAANTPDSSSSDRGGFADNNKQAERDPWGKGDPYKRYRTV